MRRPTFIIPFIFGITGLPASIAFILATLLKPKVISGLSEMPCTISSSPLVKLRYAPISPSGSFAVNWIFAVTPSNFFPIFGTSASTTFMTGKTALRKILAVMSSVAVAILYLVFPVVVFFKIFAHYLPYLFNDAVCIQIIMAVKVFGVPYL